MDILRSETISIRRGILRTSPIGTSNFQPKLFVVLAPFRNKEPMGHLSFKQDSQMSRGPICRDFKKGTSFTNLIILFSLDTPNLKCNN